MFKNQDLTVEELQELKEGYIDHMEFWEDNIPESRQENFDYVMELIKEAESREDFENINDYMNEPTVLDMDEPDVFYQIFDNK